jgi:hypothetical protein
MTETLFFSQYAKAEHSAMKNFSLQQIQNSVCPILTALVPPVAFVYVCMRHMDSCQNVSSSRYGIPLQCVR